MPIKVIPLTPGIRSSDLRNKKCYLDELLSTVTLALGEVPFYLDCDTLLGCVREGRFLRKQRNVYVTTHISLWQKIKTIEYQAFGLEVHKKFETFPNEIPGNMLILRGENRKYNCYVYTNPAFPLTNISVLNGFQYRIPVHVATYLQLLFGPMWRDRHFKNTVDARFHRHLGLLTSEYKVNWDGNFSIRGCSIRPLKKKKNTNK
jgi:hypothetical protein